MVEEASYFFTFVLEGIISFLLIALLYYALKILTSFKKGMLERGWKILSIGIIFLVAGGWIMTLSNYIFAGGYLYQLGLGIDGVGFCLAVLGFKSHYDIWSMGREVSAKLDQKEEKVAV